MDASDGRYNHWTLLVVDMFRKKVRYYDSLRGSDETEIGTQHEIENMQQSCVSMAEEVLGKMLACECIDEDLLNGPPLKERE